MNNNDDMDEYKSQNGRNKYKSQNGRNEYKSQNHGSKDIDYIGYAGMLAKPVLGALTLLNNLRSLKKTRDIAKNIRAPKVHAAITPVRPIQQLPPEVIAQQEASIASMQSKKSADATMDAIASDMMNKRKLEAENKLAVLQATTLDKERARHDDLVAKNAIRNVEALNKEIQYDADVHNKKVAIDAAYQKALQETLNKAGSDVMEGIHQRALYNEAARKQNALGSRQNILDQISIYQNSLAALGGSNPKEAGELLKEIANLMKDLKTDKSYELPGYNGVMANTFKYRNGGKLIKR